MLLKPSSMRWPLERWPTKRNLPKSEPHPKSAASVVTSTLNLVTVLKSHKPVSTPSSDFESSGQARTPSSTRCRPMPATSVGLWMTALSLRLEPSRHGHLRIMPEVCAEARSGACTGPPFGPRRGHDKPRSIASARPRHRPLGSIGRHSPGDRGGVRGLNHAL